MRRVTVISLTALLVVGATACGSAADTFDSVDEAPTTSSEPGDIADDVGAGASVPVSSATVTETSNPTSTVEPIAEDVPDETSAAGTAITQLSPQAVPSLTPTSTRPIEPVGDEFPLDPSSPLVQATVADLATRLDVPPGEVTIVDARAVTWGDSSLGCPQPGMRYLQRVTDGSLVILEAGGVHYRYTGGSPLTLCE